MGNLSFREVIDSVDHEKDNAFTCQDHMRVSFYSQEECLMSFILYSDHTFSNIGSTKVAVGHTISDLEALVRAHNLINKFKLTER